MASGPTGRNYQWHGSSMTTDRASAGEVERVHFVRGSEAEEGHGILSLRSGVAIPVRFMRNLKTIDVGAILEENPEDNRSVARRLAEKVVDYMDTVAQIAEECGFDVYEIFDGYRFSQQGFESNSVDFMRELRQIRSDDVDLMALKKKLATLWQDISRGLAKLENVRVPQNHPSPPAAATSATPPPPSTSSSVPSAAPVRPSPTPYSLPAPFSSPPLGTRGDLAGRLASIRNSYHHWHGDQPVVRELDEIGRRVEELENHYDHLARSIVELAIHHGFEKALPPEEQVVPRELTEGAIAYLTRQLEDRQDSFHALDEIMTRHGLDFGKRADLRVLPRVMELGACLDRYQQRITDQEARIQLLENNLRDAIQDNERLRVERDDLLRENHSLQGRVRSLEGENTRLQGVERSLGELRTQFAALQRENEQLKANNSRLQSAHDKTQTENRRLQGQLQEARDATALAQAAADNFQELNTRLTAQNADLQRRVEENALAQARVQELEAQLVAQETTFREEVQRLQGRDKTILDIMEGLRAEIATLKSLVGRMQNQMVGVCNDVLSLLDQVVGGRYDTDGPRRFQQEVRNLRDNLKSTINPEAPPTVLEEFQTRIKTALDFIVQRQTDKIEALESEQTRWRHVEEENRSGGVRLLEAQTAQESLERELERLQGEKDLVIQQRQQMEGVVGTLQNLLDAQEEKWGIDTSQEASHPRPIRERMQRLLDAADARQQRALEKQRAKLQGQIDKLTQQKTRAEAALVVSRWQVGGLQKFKDDWKAICHTCDLPENATFEQVKARLSQMSKAPRVLREEDVRREAQELGIEIGPEENLDVLRGRIMETLNQDSSEEESAVEGRDVADIATRLRLHALLEKVDLLTFRELSVDADAVGKEFAEEMDQIKDRLHRRTQQPLETFRQKSEQVSMGMEDHPVMEENSDSEDDFSPHGGSSSAGPSPLQLRQAYEAFERIGSQGEALGLDVDSDESFSVQVERKLSLQRSQIGQLEKKVEEQQQQLQEKEDQLQTVRQANRRLRGENTALHLGILGFRRQLKDALEKGKAQDAQILELQEENRALTEHLQEAASRWERTEPLLRRLGWDGQASTLEETLATLEQKSSRYDALKRSFESLQTSPEEPIDEMVERLRASLESQEEELTRLQKQDSSHGEIQKRIGQLEEENARLTRLALHWESIRAGVSELELDYIRQRRNSRESPANLTNLRLEELEDLAHQHQHFYRDVKGLFSDLHVPSGMHPSVALQRRIQEMQETNTFLNDENLATKAALEEKEAQLNVIQGALNAMMANSQGSSSLGALEEAYRRFQDLVKSKQGTLAQALVDSGIVPEQRIRLGLLTPEDRDQLEVWERTPQEGRKLHGVPVEEIPNAPRVPFDAVPLIFSALSSSVQALHRRQKEIEARNHELDSLNRNLNDQLVRLTEENRQLRSELSGLQQELSNLRTSLKSPNHKLQQQLDSTRQTLEDLQEQMESIPGQIRQQVASSIGVIREALSQLKTDLKKEGVSDIEKERLCNDFVNKKVVPQITTITSQVNSIASSSASSSRRR